MNNFTYENQGANTYLVYNVSADETLDSLAIGMITNNSIAGLAQTVCVQMNNEKFIKYNVSAKVSVSQFFSGVINKARLLGVFNGIVDALINSEDYMIDKDSIVFDLDYIFSDVSTCETVLICLPILDVDRPSVDLALFFKNIMFSSQFDQTENCDYVAKIMNYLNSTPSFSFVEFKNVLEDAQNGGASANVGAPVMRTPSAVAPQPVAPQPVAPQPVAPQPVAPQPVAPPPVAPQRPVNIPPQGGFAPVPPTASAQAATEEKEMSKLYLMQHYTKENKAIYEAQQAAKKNKSAGAPQPVNIPGGSANAPVEPSPAENQKPMSRLYLMQHYTKENKAIFEAQQAAKKNGQAPVVNNGVPQTPSGGAFAIPGQAAQPVTPEAAPVRPRVPVQPVAPQPVVPKPVAAPVNQPVAPKPVGAQPVAPAPAVQPRPVSQMSMNFGETTVLGGGGIGETTVLSAVPAGDIKPVPYLIRGKNNERIPVNKPVFRIGKEKSYVDYFIGDNTTISRSHANIICREDKYYIVDTNSTNHTYLNGNLLQPNSEYEIINGCKLRLANEDFEFVIC